MAFISIDPATINVGDPLKKEFFDRAKGNFDDLDDRLNNVEAGTTRVPVMKFDMRNASSFSSATGLFYYEADSDFTLTDCFIRIFEKGSLAGFLEIDIKKSTTDLADGSFTTVFTTAPKITFSGASDYDASTNQVFDPTKVDINAGDFLRLDILQAPPSGVIGRFLLTLFGE